MPIKYTEKITDRIERVPEIVNFNADVLDNSIKYQEYLAKKLDETIQYTEYIAQMSNNLYEALKRLGNLNDEELRVIMREGTIYNDTIPSINHIKNFRDFNTPKTYLKKIPEDDDSQYEEGFEE